MFKRKKDQSPKARATRAQSNIFVRLIGCGLLVYTIVQLIRAEESYTGEIWKIALIAVLGLAALLIIALTVMELIKNFKSGVYSPGFYAAKAEPEIEDSDDPPVSE